ncbi:MAG: hypothetical protein JWO11_780 [Nocardioides sp.]|nr:hypothetical protein [Nocardioides sp.]
MVLGLRTSASRCCLVLVTGGLLASAPGCSGSDPEPRMAPSESVASTPSTSAPTQSTSAPTQSATGHSLTAIETVEAWVRAQNEALRTGDTTAMKDLAASNCRGCADFSEPIEQVFADGGSFTTHGWTLIRAKVRDAAKRPLNVDAAVRIAGGSTIVKVGAEPVEYDVDHRLMVFRLDSQGSEWRISFIGFLS